MTYILEEFFGNDTGPGINGQFHLAYLLVDFLHEVDNEVHQLVFVHLLRVEVGNQEANIISLNRNQTEKWTRCHSSRRVLLLLLFLLQIFLPHVKQ